MGKQNKNKKNKMNPILWFFFAIVIPLIVAATLAVIILTVAGVNVVDWAKNTGSNIPVLSSVITTDEEKEARETEEKTRSTIEKQNEEKEQLTLEIDSLQVTIDDLEQKIIKLENKNNSEANTLVEENEPGDDPLKKASASFKKMDKKQAALIFQNLEKEIAISILQELSNDVRGSIFEEMDPKLAAELTQLLIKAQ